MALAASCSEKQDEAPRKPPGKYVQGKDSGAAEASIPDVGAGPAIDPDAAAALLDLQREVKTVPQAVSALLTSYDLEVKEGEVGKTEGSTPPIKAYAGDLVEGVKASRARLKGLAAAKDITPRGTNLNDRLKFESQAAIMNLTGIFRNMFNTAYMNRRVEATKSLLRLLDDQIEPVLAEDEDFKAELEKVHAEVEKRLDRAETVRTGLTDGIGGLDDGMFAEQEGPQMPQPLQQPQPQQQQQPAKDAGD
jgi:predicted outer membrane protein